MAARQPATEPSGTHRDNARPDPPSPPGSLYPPLTGVEASLTASDRLRSGAGLIALVVVLGVVTAMLIGLAVFVALVLMSGAVS